MTTVAIAYASRGECKTGFTLDLARLVNHTNKADPKVRLGFVTGSGSLLHEVRNGLVKDVLESDADWMLCLDDDMRFPRDALLRLLSHKRDIVGANYVTRHIPPRATAKTTAGDGWFYDVPSPLGATGLLEVDAIGMGCALINARVLKKLEKPYFSMPFAPAQGVHVGEDVYFCTQAGVAGFKVHIDHGLSREIKHVGSFEYDWDHFDAMHEFAEIDRQTQNQSKE